MSNELTTGSNYDLQAQTQATELAIVQMNEIAEQVVTQIHFDRTQNDELYDFMKDQIEIDGDKNPATREAMFKARELNMKGTDQIIELLKIKAKMINPAKGTSIQINLGKFDTEKGGDTSSMIEMIDQIAIEVEESNQD